MTDSKYNIFSELNEWFDQAEPWQKCALALLISKETLAEADLDALVCEFLWDTKVEAPPEQRSCCTLDIPASESQPHCVPRLTAIRSVSGVNALTPEQSLTIGRDLTVVYGPNGSGKSGYARLMKASCFTRSSSVDILGNIHVPQAERPVPSAVFELDGTTAVLFRLGTPCPELRDNFAVFDSSCIRAHIDEKNVFNVTPYLFDVFPRMVDVIESVNSRLRNMIDRRTPDLSQFLIPGGKSEVSQLLSDLSAESDLARIDQLAQYGEGESAALIRYERTLEELKSTDPTVLIRQKTRFLGDINGLMSKASVVSDALDNTKATAIETVRGELKGLELQSAAVSAASLGEEPLQPIGTDSWKALILAAITYSKELYPGQPFPSPAIDARCVLCQQELDEGARDRLDRFFSCVTSHLHTAIAGKQAELLSLVRPLEALDIPLVPRDSAIRRTVEDLDHDLLQVLDQLDVAYEATRRAMIEGAASDPACPEIKFAQSAYTVLVGHQSRLEKEIEELRSRNVQELVAAVENEIATLKERQFLSTRITQVRHAIENLRWLTSLKKHYPISHRAVTERQKKLIAKLVGQGFRDRFRENCAALGIDIPMEFKIAGTEGEANRRLSLQSPAGSASLPSKVLSEGEQTAVAIADFLSEIEIKEPSIGIIFDDPVSSMDHQRKERIAKKLAQSATHRQVIVFTHDILFSHYLAAEAERIGGALSFAGRTVSRNAEGAIGCVDEVAFPHRHYEGQAIERAKECLAKAVELTGQSRADYLEKACGAIRTAYEDFILRRLFNDVVDRWRENIKYVLKGVYVEESIVARVEERAAALSRHIDAHSHSCEMTQDPLTVDTVREELKAYDGIVADYKRAKKQWEAARGKTAFS